LLNYLEKLYYRFFWIFCHLRENSLVTNDLIILTVNYCDNIYLVKTQPLIVTGHRTNESVEQFQLIQTLNQNSRKLIIKRLNQLTSGSIFGNFSAVFASFLSVFHDHRQFSLGYDTETLHVFKPTPVSSLTIRLRFNTIAVKNIWIPNPSKPR